MYYEHMISRNISSHLKNTKKSVLLLGPRQVGKSTLIRSMKPDLSINLADEEEFFHFSGNPGELRSRIETLHPKTIFIDEIQRIPSLLNTIQSLLDLDSSLKFILTGSSARKLRKGGANLLPGRIFNFHLGPLVASELKYLANSKELLEFGSLPEIVTEKAVDFRQQHLRSYFTNYLKEEIKAEALVRNLEAFTRFIHVAIQNSGRFIDYSKFAKQAKISRHAFSRFYEIFEDTLIGQRVWPFEAAREDADLIRHPKFFLFDNGVFNAAIGNFTASHDRTGILAEQLIHNQFLHSAWSRSRELKISSFRTRGGLEVDFILELDGIPIAIEVKSSETATDEAVRNLKSFQSYYPKCKRLRVLHLGKKEVKAGNVWSRPWQKELEDLGL